MQPATSNNPVTAAATSADPNYNGVNPADVSVTNLDDDTYDFGDAPTSYPTLVTDEVVAVGFSADGLEPGIYEGEIVVEEDADGVNWYRSRT